MQLFPVWKSRLYVYAYAQSADADMCGALPVGEEYSHIIEDITLLGVDLQVVHIMRFGGDLFDGVCEAIYRIHGRLVTIMPSYCESLPLSLLLAVPGLFSLTNTVSNFI